MKAQTFQSWPTACFRVALRLLALMIAVHAVLFVLFDILPSTEIKLGGWMVADPSALQHYRETLGITNSGAWSRYLASLARLLSGELGSTLSGYSISRLLLDRLTLSLPALVGALVWGITLSIGLTFWALSRREPRGWMAVRAAIRAGFVPTLILAALLKTVALMMSWDAVFKSNSIEQTACICFLAGLLPACLMCSVASLEAREIMGKPFVVTLISQGRSDASIRVRLLTNVWRGVRPLLGRIVLQLIGSLMFAEIVWDVPGFGRLFSEGLQTGDYALLQSWMLIVSVLVLTCSTWEAARWPGA